MILVDSSVWIDFFRGVRSVQTDQLDQFLETQIVISGDLILAEVLQGFRSPKDFRQAKRLMTSLEVVSLVGIENAIEAAKNYRTLRTLGTTVRKTIDTLIATYCLRADVPLLYSDRDFDPFVRHLGLRSASIEDFPC